MKKAGFIPKLLVFALIIFLAWTIFGLQGDITKATARRNELKSQSVSIEVENDEMRRRLDRLNELETQSARTETANDDMRRSIGRASDEIIEEIAREELGLVMPGEQVIYD